jgi:hypothetical protein
MKLRYFLADAQGQIQKVSQAAVQDLWHGRRRAHSHGHAPVTEMRLVTVVCDDALLPTKLFLLRLPLTDGWFTQENRLSLQVTFRPECVTADEAFRHHTTGWPSDFFQQLAIVLDVPLTSLQVPLGVGGPLLTAAAMRGQALRYFAR